MGDNGLKTVTFQAVLRSIISSILNETRGTYLLLVVAFLVKCDYQTVTHTHRQRDTTPDKAYMSSLPLGGRFPLFYPISLLNIHLPPKRGKLPLFGPVIFSLKRRNCIEFSNENAFLSQQSVHKVQKYNVFASYEEF